jgi:hypothetical protein
MVFSYKGHKAEAKQNTKESQTTAPQKNQEDFYRQVFYIKYILV